jgi:glucoamylase
VVRLRIAVAALVVSLLACGVGGTASARTRAPGVPGDSPDWTAGDKHGFGTSATRKSRVWFTLRAKQMSEVYYPDLRHPSIRDLTFVVGDQGESAGTAKVEREDGSLTYTQTLETKRWQLTKTYISDPARATVLVRVRLLSLDAKSHRLTLRMDPQLYNDGRDDVAWTRGHALLAHDRHIASALVARPAFTRTSSGFVGHDNELLLHDYDALRPGNVVQAGRTSVTGLAGHRDLTLALSFGSRATLALEAAQASLGAGFDRMADSYAAGWKAYRARLKPAPAGAPAEYEASVLVLHALEDKAKPGAFVASPSMPWAYGKLTLDGGNPRSGPYHVVRVRDLYQVATAEQAAGDGAAAVRALKVMLDADPDPLDEAALPIVLAWQLGRFDGATWRRARRLADRIAGDGPVSADRWGGEAGYSPSTLAAEIAALVCAADLAVRNGDGTRASSYTRTADEWAGKVDGWTATTEGPYSSRPYFLRLAVDGKPDEGTTYGIGDSGPSKADQRRVVDAGFLELVRLGIRKADDPLIVNSLAVTDELLGGHRYTYDGYGEQRGGGPWDEFPADDRETLGRLWPVLTGERGEYELAAGRPATAQLAALADSANDGGMLPEQVWDGRAPSSKPGGGTRSAAPFGWAHAELVRLAWSVAAGRPVERPGIVACHYASVCS